MSLMLVVGVGSAWGTESVYKTALFGSDYNSNSVSSYTSTWTATNNGFTVSLTNFNNNNNSWNYVKCGRRNNASVGTITTSSAIDKAITKVVVTVDAVTANNVNSFKLYSSSDATFSNNIQTVTANIAQGTNTFTVPTPSTNQYYKIEVDCASGSSNGLVTISKIEYYQNDEGSAITPTVSIGSTSIDVGETTSVTTNGPALTLSTSNSSVASVSGTTVTGVAAGSATITATWAAGTVSGVSYSAGSKEFEVTVSEATPQNQLVTVDAEGNVTFLFNESGWGLPEGTSSNAVSTVTTYTNSGYSIILGGGSPGHYYNTSGMLIMGKSGAYLTLPAFDFDVERIEVVGRTGASSSVVQNIYVGETAVSSETTGATSTNTYLIADAYQATGNVYTLKVTSAHNTQITQIKVYKKSTAPSISFATASANVYVGGTYTQAATVYNTGSATVSYTTSNAEVATVDANGVVTGVTAGTVTITATVTVDGVEYTAEYEVTVKKNDAELSFATAVVSITENETYAGQAVTKPSDILDSEITYSSNNTTVATVNASTGAITLGNALGTTIITATFAGNTKYNAATATYTLKVTSATAASGDYEKVASTADLTDGEYLIVYEDGPVAFNGGLSTLDAVGNNISVTIADNKIESNATVDAAVFTIEAVDGGYTIHSASGYYIGRTTNKNGMDTDTSNAYTNTISIDSDGNAVITASAGAILQYNKNSDQARFRYYASGNQQAIQLYKRTNSSVSVATPVITPETGTYETRPQTVSITCSTAGATIHYTTDGTTPTTSSPVYTGSFDVRKNTTVQAIAVATIDGNTVVSRVASSVITMKVNAPVFDPADGSTFSENYNVTISADQGLTIYYITQDNKIFKSETGKTADPSESTGELVSSALVYSSALNFGQSMMVTAICMDADGNLSDPVTVKYTYTGSIVPPYYSSFSASEGDFVATNEEDGNTISGNGAPEWKMNSNTGASAIERWGEERYYMYVRGTSGNTVQTRTRWYGSAYFTSPIIDLTGKGSATFSFIHAAHHFYADPNTSASVKDATLESTLDDNKISQACKVQVGICDASGNVSTWTDIPSSSINWPEQLFDPSKTGVSADGKSTTNESSRSGLFPRANSGDISLSDYEDQKIRIRFVYTSTPSNYGTWNIDQITVNAVDVEEMTMNAKGWTTYVFDHDIDAYQTTQNYVSGGEETLKIYKVTEFDHEMCVLQQLGMNTDGSSDSERYIPAKTPVVINGPASEKIEFVLYSSPEMLPTVKNNLLIGSLSPNLAVAPAGSGVRYFVLQWDATNESPYFNKVKEGRSVPDHKAYLNGTDQVEVVSTTQSVKSQGIYVIGGEQEEATGIINVENVETAELNGEWFTLQGVRVDRPTVRGIYINNGKKVLIK